MLLIWYKFHHIKHTVLCKHFSIKSLCAFDTYWWYNKMAYNVKSLYFTLHWCAICFSNRHFILIHLVYPIIKNALEKSNKPMFTEGRRHDVCPLTFPPVSVFAIEFIREFRVRQSFPGDRSKRNAQSAQSVVLLCSSIRGVRPDGESRFCRELFSGLYALPKFLRRMTGDLTRFLAFVGISYWSRYDEHY